MQAPQLKTLQYLYENQNFCDTVFVPNKQAKPVLQFFPNYFCCLMRCAYTILEGFLLYILCTELHRT